MNSKLPYKLLATAVSVVVIATPVLAEKANQLLEINGMRGSSAESALQSRGFSHVSTHKSRSGYVNSYWWDKRDDDCVVVEVYDGRVMTINDATDQDCGHHKGSAGAAIGAVAGAAILGALLSHKSHHREGKNYDETKTAEFERGYKEGLYSGSYHNYNRDDAYAHGYEKGVDEREANLSHHQRRGGYAQNCPSDLRGNECDYYKDGYKAGAQDGSAGMSMAYERHDGYDSRFEPYFARGYTDGWRATR